MTTDYPTRHRELARGFRALGDAQPATMDGFNRLHRAATTAGALPTLTKELMALAIGVSSRCTGCIAFHVQAAIRAGATREQIEETIGVAVFMGGGPAAVYGVEALTAYDQFTEENAGSSPPGR